MGLIEKSEGNGEKAKEYLEKAAEGYISALSTVKREDIESLIPIEEVDDDVEI